ncbi:MAG: hypothetical protein HFF23_10855 [Oscillospiraceae bacterium]|jgi:hypothetical protein|nr:hypothetical protein [Oscillospiraceae bacterium]
MSKHLKQVKRQLYRNLISAYRGWWEWHKIVKGKGVGDNTAVVLLPSCEREINHLALLYLDSMLSRRKYKNAVILTHDPAVKKCAQLFSPNILRVVSFSRKKAEHLMQFYCLYEFDKRFICASLDEPNGRNGSALIGKRGTTAEEIFVIGVYRVYPFQRPEAPAYEGTDSGIKLFLEGRPE